MSVCFIHPYIPLICSKTGGYRGIHYILIFALKHVLWVLVRTASTCTHNICFEQKYEFEIGPDVAKDYGVTCSCPCASEN